MRRSLAVCGNASLIGSVDAFRASLQVYRHVLQPQHRRRQHPAMPGDQLAIIGHHARHGPAELGHAGCDLGHLVVVVDLGIASIGPQPVDRSRLDLAWRKDKVHGGGLNLVEGGHADARRRMPSGQIGVGDLGEIKNAREGFPPGELLR